MSEKNYIPIDDTSQKLTEVVDEIKKLNVKKEKDSEENKTWRDEWADEKRRERNKTLFVLVLGILALTNDVIQKGDAVIIFERLKGLFL